MNCEHCGTDDGAELMPNVYHDAVGLHMAGTVVMCPACFSVWREKSRKAERQLAADSVTGDYYCQTRGCWNLSSDPYHENRGRHCWDHVEAKQRQDRQLKAHRKFHRASAAANRASARLRRCALCQTEYGSMRPGHMTCSACLPEWKTLARRAATYGMSPLAVRDLIASGRCQICGTEEPDGPWHIDHCHATGVVRGLLCKPCNVGLGWFRDDPNRLRTAIAYLAADHAASPLNRKEA